MNLPALKLSLVGGVQFGTGISADQETDLSAFACQAVVTIVRVTP